MDQYTPAQLSDLFLQGASYIDAQFQFWIWITFATVVAGFVAGDRLTPKLRYLVAALYVVAAITLIRRTMVMAQAIALIAETLEESEAIVYPLFGWDITISKLIVFVVGTVAAVYFLVASGRPKRVTKESSE